MAIDFRIKTFDTSAVELRGSVGILAGSGNPWDDYINVPQGSWYLKSDGKVYWKEGPGDNMSNWKLVFDVADDDDDNGDDDRTYRNRWFWALSGTPQGVPAQ